MDEIKIEAHDTLKCDYNHKSLQRIRRIKGQLEALEKLIEADEGTCEERVIRARTIEKAISSLTVHMVECYLVNTAQNTMATEPQQTTQDILRILELITK